MKYVLPSSLEIARLVSQNGIEGQVVDLCVEPPSINWLGSCGVHSSFKLTNLSSALSVDRFCTTPFWFKIGVV